MAMVKCRECGEQISSSAKACPKCGKKRTSGCAMVAAWFAVIVVVVIALGQCRADKTAADIQTSKTPAQRAAELKVKQAGEEMHREAQERATGLRWIYKKQADGMGRGITSYAELRSTNLFEFGSPYGEPQRATLMLRNSPKYGKGVILQIERGQFLCRIDGCTLNISFDNGKPRRWSANESADGRSDVIFLDNYRGFVAAMKKAKAVQIEADFFQEGARVMSFHVADLDWK